MVKYRYDAWGNVLNKEVIVDCIVSNHNPFLYKGYVYDEETKWYYLQSRYYIPEIGRFLSLDSVDYADPTSIGGLNLYAYCNNDPINYCDPSGCIAISTLLFSLLIGFGLGFVIGGVSEIAKQAYNGGEWNWAASSWNLKQIGLSALGGGVAGAISSIPIGGTGIISWIGTFALGGLGSLAGGAISGSVTDLKSAAIAFTIGGVANVAAIGITTLINKGITASAQKTLNSPVFNDMSLGDLIGSGLENNGNNPLYNKLLNQAAKYLMRANGQWVKSFMYSFANSCISSVLSGWY